MTNRASRASAVSGSRSQLARALLLGVALLAAAALGMLASACGGSSSEGVARVDSTETTTTGSGARDSSRAADPAAYSACMRRNGVPKFPDPDANGNLWIIGGPGLDPNSPRFKAAEKTCEKFLPRRGNETPDPEEQAKRLQEALKYSACMRRNGVPNFPDPKSNAEGGIDVSAGGNAFDPSSPQFKAAERACRDLAPGANGGVTQRRSAPGATP
jgi:hypothetical protein